MLVVLPKITVNKFCIKTRQYWHAEERWGGPCTHPAQSALIALCMSARLCVALWKHATVVLSHDNNRPCVHWLTVLWSSLPLADWIEIRVRFFSCAAVAVQSELWLQRHGPIKSTKVIYRNRWSTVFSSAHTQPTSSKTEWGREKIFAKRLIFSRLQMLFC